MEQRIFEYDSLPRYPFRPPKPRGGLDVIFGGYSARCEEYASKEERFYRRYQQAIDRILTRESRIIKLVASNTKCKIILVAYWSVGDGWVALRESFDILAFTSDDIFKRVDWYCEYLDAAISKSLRIKQKQEHDRLMKELSPGWFEWDDLKDTYVITESREV